MLKSRIKDVLAYSPRLYRFAETLTLKIRLLPYRCTILCIVSIPYFLRPSLARLLRYQYAGIADAMDRLHEDHSANTVLFIAPFTHSRELRLAETARFAGWRPVLVYTGAPKYRPEDFFEIHGRVRNLFQLVLVMWYFRGPLIHVFAPHGYLGYLFCAAKVRPVVLDIYDTCAQFNAYPQGVKKDERKAIALADGMTHRDLRVKYLQKLHGYKLPKKNIMIIDIIQHSVNAGHIDKRDNSIHVVSVGTAGSKGVPDLMIIRTIRALCRNGIHVHVFADFTHPDMEPYLSLQRELEFFHPEQSIYGYAFLNKIAQYDFGLAILEPLLFGEPFDRYSMDSLMACGSSRIMDYIQAGLGIIVSGYPLKFQNFLARRYAPVIVPANASFLENPRSILEEALKRKSTARTINVSTITTKGTASRLGKFYSEVAANA